MLRPLLAGVLTETTAELALALTFSAARRVVEGDKFMRAGLYKGWLPTLFVGNLLQARARGGCVLLTSFLLCLLLHEHMKEAHLRANWPTGQLLECA